MKKKKYNKIYKRGKKIAYRKYPHCSKKFAKGYCDEFFEIMEELIKTDKISFKEAYAKGIKRFD